MLILVAYASKYGSTQEIAERIGGKLVAAGHEVVVREVKTAGDLSGYDGFVIGSAIYFARWRKEAAEFVRSNLAQLSGGRPVWLFSSGPLGTEELAEQGHDLREDAVPREIEEFQAAIRPRGHRVFFGALPKRLGIRDRFIQRLPAGRDLLPQGDFRSWDEIEEWTEEIVRELAHLPAGRPADRPSDGPNG